MPGLRDLQTAFGAALMNPGPADAAVAIQGRRGRERSLAIYRNNVFSNLREALRTLFPVIERLVGEEFFRYAADEYIRRYASPAGDLNRFGSRMPEFLADFEATAELMYLPDTARLEWLAHRAYHAADAGPCSLERLAAVAPERYADLRFRLHPGAALLASPYPVHRIWQVNQPGYAGADTVDLRAGPARLLVERRHGSVEVQYLDAGEWALVQALADDRTFSSACDQALAAQPDCDLGAVLSRLVAQSTLVDFSLRQPCTGNA
ncbi:MAG: DNA-binding domain-containing protein [Gammaproteobacteria bacterium]